MKLAYRSTYPCPADTPRGYEEREVLVLHPYGACPGGPDPEWAEPPAEMLARYIKENTDSPGRFIVIWDVAHACVAAVNKVVA